MNNTIIAIYGRASEGKSETAKNVCRIICDTWTGAVITTHDGRQVDYSGDILVTIKIGAVKIGIESQGDPNSRMISEDTVRKLADTDPSLGGCNIIICTCRTEGMTVSKVDEIASKFNYRSLWKSSYYTPDLSHTTVNMICAREIVELIKSLITEII